MGGRAYLGWSNSCILALTLENIDPKVFFPAVIFPMISTLLVSISHNGHEKYTPSATLLNCSWNSAIASFSSACLCSPGGGGPCPCCGSGCDCRRSGSYGFACWSCACWGCHACRCCSSSSSMRRRASCSSRSVCDSYTDSISI